jgi:hydrogenase maturation protein HypF
MVETVLREATIERRRIAVRGIVQGVGFRPFVHRVAHELGLDGFVRNDAAGVTIEAQGEPAALDRLAARLASDAPRLARVDAVDVERLPAVETVAGFAVVESGAGRVSTAIGPDSAICEDCLGELCDLREARYRYAFVNCTNCGPRYTITRALPYDRAQTSMAGFAQCPACLSEYRSPQNRRFHAEPNACPVCGPRLLLSGREGVPIEGDPIAQTLRLLRDGCVVAIKGLGGFHLACDARNPQAVSALRERKAREEKPFAVMVAGTASLDGLAAPSATERALLESPERPIVLLRKAPGTDDALSGVAPGLAWLGAMLPYTPLQYLLFHEAAGRPQGLSWLESAQDLVLVMTSANPGGEPLVIGNGEARRRLAGIADAMLMHDRDIVIRCDDSVVRVGAGDAPQFVRRARGATPSAIRLACPGPDVVALGGWYKNTLCVTRGDEAFVSQHIGDLDNAPTCVALEEAVDHLLAILEVQPAAVAHDRHPDFFSTRLGSALAERFGVPAIEVQHHHAHVAAVVAEHRVEAPVLGLALDGVGLGSDGAAWGGELLHVAGPGFRRLGHLSPLRLPGGDRAAREPWRMAASVLALLGRGDEIARRFGDEPAAAAVAQMLSRRVRSPETTSLGRWFDAAAGLLGVRTHMAFEGQAAMLLEGLAERHGPVAADRSLHLVRADGTLDLAPLAARIADEPDAGFGAALFHATLVVALSDWVAWAARESGLTTVACGGGCMLNAILSRGLRAAFAQRGLAMLEAHDVPPNDGGLALGQAWVARQTMQRS